MICAFRIVTETEIQLRHRYGTFKEVPTEVAVEKEVVVLAEREADQVGQSILVDAAHSKQAGQVVVWQCGSVMCQINCKKADKVPKLKISGGFINPYFFDTPRSVREKQERENQDGV